MGEVIPLMKPPGEYRPQYWVLGKDGRTPVPTADMHVWCELMADAHRKHVGWDFDHPRNITVSTVFLGLDHGFGGGVPILFETMIFGGKHDERMFRYATWAEAERGHWQACKLARVFPSSLARYTPKRQPPTLVTLTVASGSPVSRKGLHRTRLNGLRLSRVAFQR